jgi:diacylglycerol kinase family enzyme
MPTPPTIILNASSGTDDKNGLEQRLAEFFAARDVPAQILIADSGADIPGLARRALEETDGPIVAGGGDGTVNAVASALVDSGRTFGVLPLGTLNHFAKDLGLPLELDEAAEVLVDGLPVPVDVGEVNGRIFLNNSSLGLYPAIVHKRERLQERLQYGKWPAFVRAALSALSRYPFVEARIQVEGREIVRRSPFIFIGNNRYHIEGFDIGGRSRLDSGWLWLYAIHETGRLGLFRFAFHALRRSLREQRDFDCLCATHIRIHARRRWLRVATDGEVGFMELPLHYRIRPGALRVLVPRPDTRETAGMEKEENPFDLPSP